MTSLEDMWPAIEKAPVDDVRTLAVAADLAADTDEDLAFALRWCSGRRVRPFRRTVSRNPWTWLREQVRYNSLSRAEVQQMKEATIPTVVFDAMREPRADACLGSYPSVRTAYRDLSLGLHMIRLAVRVPDVVYPDVNVLKLPIVHCGLCSTVWVMNVGVFDGCPVCTIIKDVAALRDQTKGGAP